MTWRANTRAAATVALAALALVGCVEKASAPPSTPSVALSIDSRQVYALHQRCVETMVRSSCVAMQDSPTSSAEPASSVVMLAGIGAVDARFYAKLRAAGDTMCEALVQPCEKSWDGSECRTARALWAAL